MGSGLTGPKRQRYPIRPKNPGGVLHFPWPQASNIKSRKGIPTTELENVNFETGEFTGGEAYLPMVMHPGIRPRPFLQKGLDASLPEIDALIIQEFEVNLLDILP